jgi:hypothetical protein
MGRLVKVGDKEGGGDMGGNIQGDQKVCVHLIIAIQITP